MTRALKLDWDKASGQWNVRALDTGVVLHRVEEVKLIVPSILVSTDGGKHGYLVTDGLVTVTDNKARITKGK